MKKFIYIFLSIFLLSSIAEAGVKKFVVVGLSQQAVERIIIPAIINGKGIEQAIKIATKFKKSKAARNYIYKLLSVYIISEPESEWAQNAADIIIGAGLNDRAFEKKIDQEIENFQSHLVTFTEVSNFIDSNDSDSDCFDKNAIYSQNLSTPFFRIDNPVKEWNYGSYQELTKNSMTLDNLDNDHIPSSASILQYLSTRDRKLISKLNNLGYNAHKNSTALTISKKLHKNSRTYKGKNNKNLILEDSKNLKLATIKDFSYYFAEKKIISKSVLNSFIEIYSRNKYLCLYEGF